jgi:hypothetical protein
VSPAVPKKVVRVPLPSLDFAAGRPPVSRAVRALPALAAAAAVGAHGLLMAFPSQARPASLPSAPLGALAFLLLQVAFPSCRPSRTSLLSPLNWALFAFFLQLVVLPLSVAWAGPFFGVLPHLPSPRALDQSLFISAGAFAAFSAGCALSNPAGRAAMRASGGGLSSRMLALYAALGVTGLRLRFGSLSELAAVLADPLRFHDSAAAWSGSLTAAAGTFLRPFLLSAIAMSWCRWAERRGATAGRAARFAWTSSAALGVALVGATYEFNRATSVVPIVAMLAAYSARVRPLPMRTLAAVALSLGALSVLSGTYRTGRATAEELAGSGSALREVFSLDDLHAQLQVYGNAPQFAGFLFERAEVSHERFTPSVILGSLLSPVPILGKGLRDNSGVAIYNRFIYGESDIIDQIIPFQAEVFLCLGPLGLAGAFLAVGYAMGRLQRAFDRAGSALDCYVIQFTAIWLAFLIQGSLASVAQTFVFFFWPIYAYLLLGPRWGEPSELPSRTRWDPAA